MMPHLGVLAAVHPKAAMEVFDRDCLVYLGTNVAAKGIGKPGKKCFSWELQGDGIQASGEMNFGDIELVRMGQDQTATITCDPARGFDLGAGPGKKMTAEVRGGAVGLILDGRGRPLALPEEREACKAAMGNWVNELELYPKVDEAVAATV